MAKLEGKKADALKAMLQTNKNGKQLKWVEQSKEDLLVMYDYIAKSWIKELPKPDTEEAQMVWSNYMRRKPKDWNYWVNQLFYYESITDEASKQSEMAKTGMRCETCVAERPLEECKIFHTLKSPPTT